jgi:CheY-like chemotaxis protein
VNTEISGDITNSVSALQKKETNCVILDMGMPGSKGYETLDVVKKHSELEQVPIIIFTGKSLSRTEEQKIRQYADAIVVKTAHSYQRILNEVSLFLHLVDQPGEKRTNGKGLGTLDIVLKDKTVLVADDDVRNIFALTRALEKHKMHVVTAIDGKEALQQLEQGQKIDIVLMDMMMPEMDGYETIRRIRKESQWKRLPIIAVTAKAMMEDREKCIAAGASDYISKPIDSDQLLSLMRVWLYETV